MKKIILSIFVLTLLISTSVSAREVENRGERENKIKNASSTLSELKTKGKDVDTVCVMEAVNVREESISSAWKNFSDKMTASLETRKASLVSAWSLTDVKERKLALKKSWDSSKKDKKNASLEYKNKKKEIWSTFKTSVKKCGSSVGSEASGESEVGEKIEI